MKATIKLIREIGIFTIALTLALVVNFVYAAWNNPSSAPTSDNTDAPINTGSDAQTKSGTLTVSALLSDTQVRACAGGECSYLRLPIDDVYHNYLRGHTVFNGALVDEDNNTYFLNPDGWNVLNNLQIHGDTSVRRPLLDNDIANKKYVDDRETAVRGYVDSKVGGASGAAGSIVAGCGYGGWSFSGSFPDCWGGAKSWGAFNGDGGCPGGSTKVTIATYNAGSQGNAFNPQRTGRTFLCIKN